jgi:hypothetical protein
VHCRPVNVNIPVVNVHLLHNVTSCRRRKRSSKQTMVNKQLLDLLLQLATSCSLRKHATRTCRPRRGLQVPEARPCNWPDTHPAVSRATNTDLETLQDRLQGSTSAHGPASPRSRKQLPPTRDHHALHSVQEHMHSHMSQPHDMRQHHHAEAGTAGYTKLPSHIAATHTHHQHTPHICQPTACKSAAPQHAGSRLVTQLSKPGCPAHTPQAATATPACTDSMRHAGWVPGL